MDEKLSLTVKDCIYARRTIRKYTDEKVSDEDMKEILMAGLQAPSACNFQAWKFIVVNTEEKRQEFLNA